MYKRQSLSTLIDTKCSFKYFAIVSLSNDSCSMTWHQWHVEYPIERKIGLSSFFDFSKASSDQGYQSTGLCACCSKYGDVSLISLFVCFLLPCISVIVSRCRKRRKVARFTWHNQTRGANSASKESLSPRKERDPFRNARLAWICP